MSTTVHTGQQDRLQQALDALYSAFEPYRYSLTGHRSEAQLLARPLRELSPDDLHDFAWASLWAWGSVDDFKHFLPRLFELAARDRPPCDLDVLFRKLSFAQWRTWPVAEQLAVENYLGSLWTSVLNEPVSTSAIAIDEWLGALAGTASPNEFEVFLEDWQLQLSGPAAEHLARFVSDVFNALMVGRMVSPYWVALPAHEQVLRRWLASRSLHKTIERAFFETSIAAESQALSDALSILEIYAKLPAMRASDEEEPQSR